MYDASVREDGVFERDFGFLFFLVGGDFFVWRLLVFSDFECGFLVFAILLIAEIIFACNRGF